MVATGNETPPRHTRSMDLDVTSLDDALRTLTGRPDAAFREHQREAVEALVDRQRVLVVQRTGWGKSAVYFLATHLLRARGSGPTLLISPLLALMRNQIDAATRLGLRSMTVNSSASTTVDELADALNTDSLDLILVSPERLANPEFAAKVMPINDGWFEALHPVAAIPRAPTRRGTLPADSPALAPGPLRPG